MLVMVVFFIAFIWIHLSTPLIRLFLLVLILLLMPTLNFLPVWFALSLLFFFSSRRRHTILQGDWSSDVCSSDLDRQRESGPRGMTIVAAAPLVLGAAACISFAFRKRLVIVAPFALAAIAAAAGRVLDVAPDSNGTLLDLELRVSPLGQLAALVILGTLLLLVLDVWLDEPAYNFFPTALAVGATALGVLVVTAPLAIFGLLVLGLLVPVGSFTFQIQRNRSVEAATRHFAFVALGGSLGIASLALSQSLPHDQPANTFVLLAVV